MQPIGAFLDAVSLDRASFVAASAPAFLVCARDTLAAAAPTHAATVERPMPDRARRAGTPPAESYLVGPLAPRTAGAATVRVGRLDECDVVIPDPSVSRRHAAFTVREDDVVVTDLDSTLGTRVNGVHIEPHAAVALRAADRISLGDVEVYFLPASAFYDFVRRHFDLDVAPG